MEVADNDNIVTFEVILLSIVTRSTATLAYMVTNSGLAWSTVGSSPVINAIIFFCFLTIYFLLIHVYLPSEKADMHVLFKIKLSRKKN